ncbi:MAG: ssDNA-binding domain-containing protein [Muribaculaceae bacterium]|nr:ssDNA-binding domain-containing protein [Muribaculaceae bacterium]
MKTEQIYQMVTDRVIEKLKEGVCPWVKPWKGGNEVLAMNAITKRPYSFLNQMLLGFDGQYLTFNQAKQLGGSVRKGSKSRPVVFWTTGYTTKGEDEEGNPVSVFHEYARPVLKYYNVFEIRDIDGIDINEVEPEFLPSDVSPIDEAEKVIMEYSSRTNLTIERKYCAGACYRPSDDKVIIPIIQQYDHAEAFYSTAFHELIHSTGAKNRLDRDLSGLFGSSKYGREELIAEIGAAFCLARLGLDANKCFDNSVAYLQSWINTIQADPKAIVIVAGKAEKAVNMIFDEV